jgi:hypothetical protein
MAAIPITVMIMPNTMLVMRSGERDMLGGEIYNDVWEREYGKRGGRIDHQEDRMKVIYSRTWSVIARRRYVAQKPAGQPNVIQTGGSSTTTQTSLCQRCAS